jgi:hypothetical protein
MNQGGKNKAYERFEALTRRLAKVSKKEVDDLERADSTRTDPSERPEDDGAEGEQRK